MSDYELETRDRAKTQRPKKFTVVFINDDFTPVDFVIQILTSVFGQTAEDAARITMDIHQKGKGAVGMYPFEVAETKSAQAMSAAKAWEYPLTCKPEPS
jgi:ATP-dependent Clp protease adaptor protein ClpS